MKKSHLILNTILVAAVIALGFGFYVMKKRIDNPPVTVNQEQETNTDQNENTQETQPENTEVALSSTTGWKTYTNDRHKFTVQYPPHLKAGSVSENTVLGTFQVPVRGLHVGPLVLVALKDADIKKDAQELFNGVYEAASQPKSSVESEVPPIECKIDNVKNSSVVSLKSVSCIGEGGPAKYAYITGKSYDVFVDGYSKGYDDQDNGNLSNEQDYATILSTFIFVDDQPTTPSPTPTPSSSSPSPSPSASTDPDQPVSVPPPMFQSFTINADDAGATPSEITVNKNALVQITFTVGQNTYYGGLDFRSSVVNSGTINAGSSKTISFRASESFFFTPYWPASQVAKNYKVNVTVQ